VPRRPILDASVEDRDPVRRIIHQRGNSVRRTFTTFALVALVPILGVVVPASPAHATVIYTVRNANDSGVDSLRDVIVLANRNAGPDEIHFDIPGVGAQTINLVTDLPSITNPVRIDGYTQPGAVRAAAGNNTALRVVINASNVAYGLDLRTDDSVITGLVVQGAAGPVAAEVDCDNAGICVTGADNVISGNYVGVSVSGKAALGNNEEGVRIEGDGNVVGGSDPGDHNVISANGEEGISIEGAKNVVQGNLVGIAVGGAAALGNTAEGVKIAGDSNKVGGNGAGEGNVISGNGGIGVYANGNGNAIAGNLIGTDTSGGALLANGEGVYLVGDKAQVTDNVISGNGVGVTVHSGTGAVIQRNLIGTDGNGRVSLAAGDIGILTGSASTNSSITGNVIGGMGSDGIELGGSGSTVQSNKIGADKDGTASLGNNTGLRVTGDDNLIGGTAAGTGNVISGNLADGVVVESQVSGTDLHGNLIGVDITGFAPLGNGGCGVLIDGGGNTLGGHAAGEGNVIAANVGDGVVVDGGDTLVEGNLIGVVVGPAGSVRLGNGGHGVRIAGSTNRVGGVDKGAGNVIGGNLGHGIELEVGSDNQIVANTIGTDISGTNLRNRRSGIHVLASTNVIGSTDPTVAPNMIAFNGGDGVTVETNVVSANAIVGNVIVDNRGLGIDLNPNNVTVNDNNVLDADTGANDLQNYPVVGSAVALGTGTEVSWTLDSLASSNFRLEFFAVNACDASGHGEAGRFLDERLVKTDYNGMAALTTQTAGRANVGQYVVMTATYVSVVGPPLVLGATSEFSACVLVV